MCMPSFSAPLAGFSSLPGCKPLENCIFISIVYLLRHLFAFDLPGSTENSTAEKIHANQLQTTTACRWSAFESFTKIAFPPNDIGNI